MFNCKQLRDFVIKPILLDLMLYSVDVEELLVFTCANESEGGTYLKQEGGPALGIYQMEPVTYNDIWQNYIEKRSYLKLKLTYSLNAPTMPSEDRMIYDLYFATAMARIFYLRHDEPLPKASDTAGIYNYYKKYYNTVDGKANYEEAVTKYLKFIKP
jgi:hypothetical protein